MKPTKKFKRVIESTTKLYDFSIEDSGKEQILTIENDKDSDSENGIFVRVQSSYEDKSHPEMIEILKAKKI